MEERILGYEEKIKKLTEGKLNKAERNELWEFHVRMIQNFQHERAIHLAVTLFFAGMAVVFSILTTVFLLNYRESEWIYGAPLFILTFILIVLTGAYVKHYYFLENHVQALYKYNEKFLQK
ncbi:MAG: hypothetical protein Q4F60_00210 [Candidatus Saccharibacteria bacterium]|nr:hypothetical protein [Candidatus Saccharibacteria bacterium]